MPSKAPYPFVAYTGVLSKGARQWPIRFQMRLDQNGELRFLVRPMSLTAETSDIRNTASNSSTVPFFRLEGTSRDGRRFHSDHMVMRGMSHSSTPTSSRLKLKLKCSKGVLRREAEGSERTFVRYWLRGFEAYPAIHTTCELGEVVMQGRHPAPSDSKPSGLLQVRPIDPPVDFSAWRKEVEALCLHIQSLMSFAQSRVMKAPIEEIWDGTNFEEVILGQSKSRRPGQPVIHPMTLQGFFQRAVAAYFSPPISVKNLSYAMEWFAMDAAYTETRLMNAMTALECLTDSNLSPDETAFFSQKRFRKIAEHVRKAAPAALAATKGEANEGAQPLAEQAFLGSLPAKLMDLNRRPIAEKVMLLADRWGVPLWDLLTDGAMANAFSARNKIVHRGWYYQPDAGTPEERDLWDHVYLMREVVIRFVLTALRYEGSYLSFHGGQHDVVFPPPPAS